MEDLKCPVCGQMNPPDSETCSQCGSSLHAPIQPGQLPTKKVTSELEPILPDWLRDARERSREQGTNDLGEPVRKETGPFGANADLLAGLASQAGQDDEEEVPDWLAGITGEKGHKKQTSEFTGTQRVELKDFGEPEPEAPAQPVPEEPKESLSWLSDLSKPEPAGQEANDLQDWFKEAAAPAERQQPEPPVEPTQMPPADEGSVLDWLDSLRSETAAPAAPSPSTEGAIPAVPDWLKDLSNEPAEPEQPAESVPAAESRLDDWTTGLPPEAPALGPEVPQPAITPADLPDWVKDLRPEAEPLEPAAPEKSLPAAEGSGSLDWLRNLQEPAAPGQKPQTPAFEEPASADWTSQAIPSEEDTAKLDWLKDVQEPAPSAEEEIPTPAFQSEPDWFIQASQEAEPPEKPEAASVSPLDVELPDWLKSATPESLAEPEAETELPDWMKTPGPVSEPPAAEESGIPAWLSGANAPITPEEPVEAFSEVPLVGSEPAMPDWLSNLASLETTAGEEPETGEALPESLPALPAAELPSGDLNSLFTNIPDWLSESAPASGAESAATPTPTEPGEPLSPANLPSWVQAMRPVEAALPAYGEAGEEAAMETKGALAGLRGVLPSSPYLGAAAKPKAQSYKLQATEEQQNHGALLEQVLESETHPEPMVSASRPAAQRGLRLAIGVLLFLVLLGTVLAGTTFTPLPVGWPAETVSALKAVEAVPAGSPVLVVFDYEPSLAGEMEAAAAPLLDHLIVRNHPRLTLLSTSATGPALAERLFSGPLGELAYQDRINLGYLPGGLSGVRGFAQNPALAMPLDANSEPLAPGAQNFSDYAAILVLTDSIDGGRTWIEQARPLYSGKAFVVVASAQAGPMLQPYYHSGQIHGLVSGLFDASVLEQNNAGRPGLARRYWDAFNAGLILAVILITIGSLWSLVTSLRDRALGEAQ